MRSTKEEDAGSNKRKIFIFMAAVLFVLFSLTGALAVLRGLDETDDLVRKPLSFKEKF